MAFKPKGDGKNPQDLMGLLVNSKIQTTNNALYQTIFGLITIQQAALQAAAADLEALQNQIDALDTSKDEGIPAFFFMGSS